MTKYDHMVGRTPLGGEVRRAQHFNSRSILDQIWSRISAGNLFAFDDSWCCQV